MTDAICSVVECIRPTRLAGMCGAHHQRKLRHGNPLHGGPLKASPGDRVRFFYTTLYTVTDSCKLWEFATVPGGYGVIQIEGKQYSVHRLACMAWNGPPPATKQLAAHGPCHNRTCYNGQHLSWSDGSGQWLDQVRDGTAMLGVKNHATKLTPEIVTEIRRRYALGGFRQVDLATEFGIKQPAISSLIRRETWWHVP